MSSYCNNALPQCSGQETKLWVGTRRARVQIEAQVGAQIGTDRDIDVAGNGKSLVGRGFGVRDSVPSVYSLQLFFRHLYAGADQHTMDGGSVEVSEVAAIAGPQVGAFGANRSGEDWFILFGKFNRQGIWQNKGMGDQYKGFHLIQSRQKVWSLGLEIAYCLLPCMGAGKRFVLILEHLQ